MNSESLTDKIIQTRDIKPNSVRAYITCLQKLNQKTVGERDFNNLKFLMNIERVEDAIKDFALTTRRNYLASIIVALKTDEKKYEKLIQKYSKILDDLSKEHRDFILTQQKTEKQSKNWLSFNEIKKVRTELNRQINADGLRKKTTLSKKEMNLLQKHLILSLYIDIPPIRNDFGDMRVVTTKEFNKKKESEKKTNNWLIKNGNNMKFIFYDYKTHKTYGEKTIEIPKKLKRIIKKMLEYNNSGYLLIKQNGTPLNSNGITRELNSIFSKYGKKIGSTMLRHIYLSNEFAPLLKKQHKIADAMFHSTDLQQKYVKN